jgi:hypothetical protein
MTAEKKEIAEKKTLAGKLVAVMMGIHRVKKGGFNEHHRYAFVTAEDVSDMVRDLLAEQGIAFMPSMESYEMIPTASGKGHIARVKFIMRFLDSESSEVQEATWFSEAMDTQDKALNKAATAAVKYFLLKTFLISTGDEPDTDAEVGEEAKQARAAASSPKITAIQLSELKSLVVGLKKEWPKFQEHVTIQTNGFAPEDLDTKAAIFWISKLRKQLTDAAKEANSEEVGDDKPASEDTSRVRSRVRGSKT